MTEFSAPTERGMFATTDLIPLLVDRGLRSVPGAGLPAGGPGVPQRLNLTALAALCDILDCTPGDLIEPHALGGEEHNAKGASVAAQPARPRRARILPARRSRFVAGPPR